MVACTGPLATISRKPRQARKGATVVVTSGAGVWLVQVTTQQHCYILCFYEICPCRLYKATFPGLGRAKLGALLSLRKY